MKKINVRSLGTPEFIRYIVVNGDKYWNGTAWVADRKAALLFATFKEASKIWRTLREEAMEGMSQQHFEAQVVITVGSDGQPVDEERLRDFLANNARIVVDLEHEPEFMIDAEIDWNTLTPVPQANPDPRTLAKSIYNELKNKVRCDPGSVDAALDPNRMRLLDWNERPACKQVWINAVARALERMRNSE